MIQSIIFILAMTFIPYFVGCGCILLDRKTGDIDVLEKWNFGMVLMHAIFEIVVLAGTFTKMTLKNVTVFYFAILSVAIMIVGLIGNRTKKRVFSVGKIPSFSKKEMTLLLIVLVGILYQILFVCLGLQSDADDAYYVGMAMTSFQTDTISVYHPYLGTPVKLKTMANYVLSPYPIFWAMWSKVLKIHPAILMRSILPAVNIAWSYVVYRLLAKKIFLTERKRIIFLLIVVLANLFGAYSYKRRVLASTCMAGKRSTGGDFDSYVVVSIDQIAQRRGKHICLCRIICDNFSSMSYILHGSFSLSCFNGSVWTGIFDQ